MYSIFVSRYKRISDIQVHGAEVENIKTQEEIQLQLSSEDVKVF